VDLVTTLFHRASDFVVRFVGIRQVTLSESDDHGSLGELGVESGELLHEFVEVLHWAPLGIGVYSDDM
jgi:hypothetical protein